MIDKEKAPAAVTGRGGGDTSGRLQPDYNITESIDSTLQTDPNNQDPPELQALIQANNAETRRDYYKEKLNPPSDPWQAFTLADAYKERPPIKYIVAGMFALPSLSIVYGAPGSFKSLLVADLALCVSAGIDWLPPAPWIKDNQASGFNTFQCPVMWIDFDNGQLLTHDRIEALARSRNLPESIPFTYYSIPNPWLDGTDKNSIGMLAQRIKDKGVKLVVIDNLKLVSGDAEENSGDMSQVMSLFRQLAEETGAAVILIHHQRKSNGAGGRAGDALRGHSSIEAALDLALLVDREALSDYASIMATKTRGADVLPFSAVFTFEHKPNTKDLLTAKFFGLNTEDSQSNNAIKNAVKTALFGVTMNKTDLVKAVKDNLDQVGVNRIRDYIERMVKAGELLENQGNGTTKIYRLP